MHMGNVFIIGKDILSCAQGLFLVLCLGISPGSAWDIICSAMDQTGTDHMQDKRFNPYAVSTALFNHFEAIMYAAEIYQS